MNPITACIGREYFLFDADTLSTAQSKLFDVDYHRSEKRLEGTARGRGEAYFFSLNGGSYLLRHYRRGGWMQGVLGDRYLWGGIEGTRAFREWKLLAKLVEHSLPVPRPLAARVVRQGIIYRADIITHRVRDAHSLAAILNTRPLSAELWEAMGQCIRTFHDSGVCHGDLNAHNILIQSNKEIFLIDFDKSRIMSQGNAWKTKNLMRLRRSLVKLRRLNRAFHVCNKDFDSLMGGYRSARD
jgi:3-deoxy-D-manno-octulosonic acid kinase